MKQNLVVIFWCEWNVHTGVLSGRFISVVLKLSPRATDNSVGGGRCAVLLRVWQGIALATASGLEPKPASSTATSRGVRTANDKLPASDLLAPSSNLSWMMDHLALSRTHLSRAELEFTSDDGLPTPPTRTPLALGRQAKQVRVQTTASNPSPVFNLWIQGRLHISSGIFKTSYYLFKVIRSGW